MLSIFVFSNSISEIPQAIVKVARFKGKTPVAFIDMEEFDANLIKTVDDVIKFIKRHTSSEIIISGKAKHDKLWDYPLIAVREAVVNALVHRDYLDSGNIQIRIFDDRLEVWSPGLLPKELSIKSIPTWSRSIPRNKVLAKLFKAAAVIENWGTGFPRIISACEANKNPGPEFLEKQGAFIIIFKKRSNEGLNSLLKTIQKNPGIKAKDTVVLLNNRPLKTLERQIKELIKKSLIEHRGSRKTGGYYVK
jgi:ATP-dependent DNA helicase RecG